ncbi:MAG: branched-chain amino acid transaminase [Gemmatimonadaceae bacterium]|nr:branched-chain amino acid transaminase [Gemmatimonadaceae bacterium]NUQ93606.1 branched-chain amino acid transaminase [Gemmatimonadaceae bacterium]NUR19069.1 branched-chain amino acid transaminase [Gemmatimonadaceae bacterium]
MATPTNGRTQKIWRDGQLIAWEDATIHVMSHVVHYGSSVFEGVRCYSTPNGPAIFRLREHMRRLLDSCKIYRLPITHSLEDLVQASVDTVAANELDACYLRPLVIRGGEQMGVFQTGIPVETFIIAWHWGTYLGHDALENGVDVRVSSWRRAAPSTFPTLAKAGGNYLNSQLAKAEARQDGYSEGIMLDTFGYVSEGSGENLFIVRDGTLYTSPLASAILNGITRDSVAQIARDLGYTVREQQIPREMLYVADELFFTGTAAEITPIRSVDRIPVGEGKPGPITLAIQKQYMGIATGRVPDAHGWLTPVPATAGATR